MNNYCYHVKEQFNKFGLMAAGGVISRNIALLFNPDLEPFWNPAAIVSFSFTFIIVGPAIILWRSRNKI